MIKEDEDGQEYVKRLASFLRKYGECLTGSPAPGGKFHPLRLGRAPSIYTKAQRAVGLVSGPGPSPLAGPGSYAFTLSPHHLYYLLSQFKTVLKVQFCLDVRAESIHSSSLSTNYVSFLNDKFQSCRYKSMDAASITSVSSSIRMSLPSVSSLFGNWGASRRGTRADKSQLEHARDLRDIYDIFCSCRSFQIAPDDEARLISGYAEYPFDLAVPISIFQNAAVFELTSVGARSVFGWDKLADRVSSLRVDDGSIADIAVVTVELPYDDAREIRMISPKRDGPYVPPIDTSSVASWLGIPDFDHLDSVTPDPHMAASPTVPEPLDLGSGVATPQQPSHLHRPNRTPLPTRFSSQRSPSPPRRPGTASVGRSLVSEHSYGRTNTPRSNRRPSVASLSISSRTAGATYLAASPLPLTKWRSLRHLRMARNGFTNVSAFGLYPLANSLEWLDLSANLFTTVPASLAILTKLTTLDLSDCQITSLSTWATYPLPSLHTLQLNQNKLDSLDGIEALPKLKRVDVRNNLFTNPADLAPLTQLPALQSIMVEGNPFTKDNKNYRIAIFNLFRQTPGYQTDITIDSLGPTVAEKKLLLDQVPGIHLASVRPSTDSLSRPRVTYLSFEDIERMMDQGQTPRSRHTRSRSELVFPRTNSGSNSNNNSARRRAQPARPTIYEMGPPTPGSGKVSNTRPVSALLDYPQSTRSEQIAFHDAFAASEPKLSLPAKLSPSEPAGTPASDHTPAVSSALPCAQSPASIDTESEPDTDPGIVDYRSVDSPRDLGIVNISSGVGSLDPKSLSPTPSECLAKLSVKPSADEPVSDVDDYLSSLPASASSVTRVLSSASSTGYPVSIETLRDGSAVDDCTDDSSTNQDDVVEHVSKILRLPHRLSDVPPELVAADEDEAVYEADEGANLGIFGGIPEEEDTEEEDENEQPVEAGGGVSHREPHDAMPNSAAGRSVRHSAESAFRIGASFMPTDHRGHGPIRLVDNQFAHDRPPPATTFGQAVVLAPSHG